MMLFDNDEYNDAKSPARPPLFVQIKSILCTPATRVVGIVKTP